MDAQRKSQTPDSPATDLVYSPVARLFHWLTAAAIFILIPVGLYMVERGHSTNFDATTNTLYSAHKLAGFLVLWLVVARLVYRLVHGAPADEPTLEWWQKAAAHMTHWGLYALLLIVPLLGWYGVSLYGALGLPGGFSLPAIAAKDQKAAEFVLFLHGTGAKLIMLGVAAHVGAALFHHIIRGDGVLRRMLPGLKAKKRD